MYIEPKGFKGTPYEWRFIERNLEGNIENSRIPYGIEAIPDFANGVIPVMDSCAFPPNNKVNLERMKSDAALLSNAKELAKALQDIVSDAVTIERNNVAVNIMFISAAKAALAKAII